MRQRFDFDHKRLFESIPDQIESVSGDSFSGKDVISTMTLGYKEFFDSIKNVYKSKDTGNEKFVSEFDLHFNSQTFHYLKLLVWHITPDKELIPESETEYEKDVFIWVYLRVCDELPDIAFIRYRVSYIDVENINPKGLERFLKSFQGGEEINWITHNDFNTTLKESKKISDMINTLNAETDIIQKKIERNRNEMFTTRVLALDYFSQELRKNKI